MVAQHLFCFFFALLGTAFSSEGRVNREKQVHFMQVLIKSDVLQFPN